MRKSNMAWRPGAADVAQNCSWINVHYNPPYGLERCVTYMVKEPPISGDQLTVMLAFKNKQIETATQQYVMINISVAWQLDTLDQSGAKRNLQCMT